MERQRCKLCFKFFVNGKALGGHMRTHLMNQPVSDQRRPNRPENPKRSEETSSSSDPEFPVVLQDRESETESSRNPTRRRSKRVRKFKPPAKFRSNFEPKRKNFEFRESWTEQEPVSSSISDVTTEEDVAFCLMMMSRDKWKKQRRKNPETSESARDEETDDEEEEDEDEETDGKYTCETCPKTFRSYQALGGHRASHRKNQTAAAPPPPPLPEIATSAAVRGEAKVHECPYCLRVFGSGQALGGHKRTHAAIYGSVSGAGPVSKKARHTVIDLNLPAPEEEGQYGEVEF